MKPWPYDYYTIDTALTREQVLQFLAAYIEPSKLFRLSRDHRTFQGTLQPDGFKISRIIHYRNSFIPILVGTLKETSGGTRMCITCRLHFFTLGFMIVWFAGVSTGLTAGLVSSIHDGNSWPFIAVPLGMLLFGWALTTIPFWLENNKAKALLLQMFDTNQSKRT